MAVVEAAAADHAAPPLQEEAPGAGAGAGADAGEREMRDLEDLLSKLNPMAEEFVPPSLASPAALTPAPLSPAAYGFYPAGAGFAVASPGHGGVVGFPAVADAHAARGRVRTLLDFGLPPLRSCSRRFRFRCLPADDPLCRRRRAEPEEGSAATATPAGGGPTAAPAWRSATRSSAAPSTSPTSITRSPIHFLLPPVSCRVVSCLVEPVGNFSLSR
jgi:hypothetical protein